MGMDFGLELGIDVAGADQGSKSQSFYPPSAWGLPGTMTTVPFWKAGENTTQS